MSSRLRKTPRHGSNEFTDPRGISSNDVGELYAKHATRVQRWAGRFFPGEEAQEIVHEIFVKVLERIDGFRNDASPTTWLYRMTTNHCINRLRDQSRRAELWQTHGSGAPWLVPVAPADQDTCAFLQQFWRELDDDVVASGFYYFVDGMTHSEIARVQECSPRTIGHRLERLRAMAQESASDHRRGVRHVP